MVGSTSHCKHQHNILENPQLIFFFFCATKIWKSQNLGGTKSKSRVHSQTLWYSGLWFEDSWQTNKYAEIYQNDVLFCTCHQLKKMTFLVSVINRNTSGFDLFIPFSSVTAIPQTCAGPAWARCMWCCYWLLGPASRCWSKPKGTQSKYSSVSVSSYLYAHSFINKVPLFLYKQKSRTETNVLYCDVHSKKNNECNSLHQYFWVLTTSNEIVQPKITLN